MRFILNNLLSNAVKYSPEGGKVELEIFTDEKNLLLHVSDEGIGISSNEKVKIFDSFYRASNVKDISGTGLGLAIVKRSVDLHNGAISFISELNLGTTFKITIPIVSN